MKDSKSAKDIFSSYDSESPIATEFRRIYNNLKKHCTPADNSFLITSSNRGEGKSTIASHLALTIAQFTKKKVLIIDSDLRRPMMHKIFKLDNLFGFKECLSDSQDPLQAVKKTHQKNLYVITAGARTGTPSSLFESETVANVIKKVQFYYDYVIVDSAPVLAVSDTLFLGAILRKTIFVVLAGVTPREVVLRARDVLLDSNAEILGVVLNNALEVLPYYYDYKYYEYDRFREI
ncbi:MAG: polysaccharide biosynthesis tyrosine autokinase [Candidatus Latescibacteria bacterium]|nr:polysaccharide biosynthesis tyrosine autokinase [Candidatus Latescibacterota bacterium]NIM21506.1 polysaccharide biosynthesis tyrosine autokinase [Candidatus Latescibacterota bacterium]NIM65677.1 polysaccharide biosynthesis tyrosine autokinase [Candidatus Latescibacterota bacterium]NIO02059.1 polysaccharide biosynthesis tyrosine autokinase [Candidatus Latescibacterota bacterium]NIO28871.1 polysaccharide biosynthesis tyrosine autokinase [Candidatus Latescibacterota bacterium]